MLFISFFRQKHQRGELKNAGVNAGVKLSKLQEKIIALIVKNSNVSQAEIAKNLKINASTVYRNIEKLKQLEVLERKGADKTGSWVVTLSEAKSPRQYINTINQ